MFIDAQLAEQHKDEDDEDGAPESVLDIPSNPPPAMTIAFWQSKARREHLVEDLKRFKAPVSILATVEVYLEYWENGLTDAEAAEASLQMTRLAQWCHAYSTVTAISPIAHAPILWDHLDYPVVRGITMRAKAAGAPDELIDHLTATSFAWAQKGNDFADWAPFRSALIETWRVTRFAQGKDSDEGIIPGDPKDVESGCFCLFAWHMSSTPNAKSGDVRRVCLHEWYTIKKSPGGDHNKAVSACAHLLKTWRIVRWNGQLPPLSVDPPPPGQLELRQLGLRLFDREDPWAREQALLFFGAIYHQIFPIPPEELAALKASIAAAHKYLVDAEEDAARAAAAPPLSLAERIAARERLLREVAEQVRRAQRPCDLMLTKRRTPHVMPGPVRPASQSGMAKATATRPASMTTSMKRRRNGATRS